MQSSREPALRYHAKVHSLSNSNSQESQCSLSHLSQASSQVDLSSDDGSTARSAQEYSERSIYLTRPLKVNAQYMQECLVQVRFTFAVLELYTVLQYNAKYTSRKTVSLKLNFELTSAERQVQFLFKSS